MLMLMMMVMMMAVLPAFNTKQFNIKIISRNRRLVLV